MSVANGTDINAVTATSAPPADTSPVNPLAEQSPSPEKLVMTTISEFRGSYPDIPLPSDIDIADLKRISGEDELFFVTLPIGEVNAVSGNGRTYTERAVRDIVEQVNLNRPDGIWGHMRDDEVATRFDPPSIKWLAATLDENGVAWAKGIPLNKETREYYRYSKATNARVGTSIFAYASVRQNIVESLDLVQIDIAQPSRVGVPITAAMPHLTLEMNEDVRVMARASAPITPAPITEIAIRPMRLVSEMDGAYNFTTRVDRESRVIYDAVVAIANVDALGKGYGTDEKTITAIAKLGNARSEGVLGYFDHDNSTGRQILRAKNFRIEGEAVIADLHFFEQAYNAPIIGDALSWVFDMAEQHPESIALSIVWDGYLVWKLDNGAELRVDWVAWRWGWDERPDNATTKEPTVRIETLWNVDVVAEGAITQGLFSKKRDPIPVIEMKNNKELEMSDVNETRISELETANGEYQTRISELTEDNAALTATVAELTTERESQDALIAELLVDYTANAIAAVCEMESMRDLIADLVNIAKPNSKEAVDKAIADVMERPSVKSALKTAFVSEMGEPLKIHNNREEANGTNPYFQIPQDN